MTPKVLTLEELNALPRLSIIWVEHYDGEEKKASSEILAAMKCYDGTFVDEDACIYNDLEKDIEPDPLDGSRWRFWDTLPTPDQSKAVPWE